MPKSFLQMLNEAPMPPMGGSLGGSPPPPPPSIGGGGMGGPSLGLGGGGGMGGMGGGMGGLGGGMGDPGAGQQPVPVKTIDAMDVWEVLKNAYKDMEKHEELNINYGRKKPNQKKPIKNKTSSLMT